MNTTTAMREANTEVTRLISNLKQEHKEQPTPCDEWTVHELIEHLCGGVTWIAGLLDQQPPPPEDAPKPDLLADGPAAGWARASEALEAAATKENLEGIRPGPFGEVPGEVALSVIVADTATHAWDLATATDQRLQMSDELAQWTLDTWKPIVPAGERDGKNFADELHAGEHASILERMLAYTGRKS